MLLRSVPSIFNAGRNWNLWELWRDLQWEGFRVVCWICLVPILLSAIEGDERYPKIWLKLAKQTSIYTLFVFIPMSHLASCNPYSDENQNSLQCPSFPSTIAAVVKTCSLRVLLCTATLLQTLRVSFSIVFSMVWDNGIARFVHVFCTPTQGTSYSSIRAMKP